MTVHHEPPTPGDTPWPRHGADPVLTPSPPAVAPPVAPPVAGDGQEAADPADPAASWVAGGAGSEPRGGWLRLAMLVAALAVGTVLLGPYVLIVIAALVISIVLHEFGHYWTARRAGMKVTEFFVGFGPRVWSFRRGETAYGIKAIPAGAYVKIIGMNNLEEVDPADEDRTYRAKGTFRRLSVVLAGPAMNFLLAVVLLFTVTLIQGKADPVNWTVGRVVPGSSAADAGIQEGDRLLAIEGQPVGEFDGFRDQLDSRVGLPTTFLVERSGQQVELSTTLGWRLGPAAQSMLPSDPPLQTGDRVLTVDGRTVGTYEEFRQLLGQPGDPVTLRIERLGNDYDLDVSRPIDLPADGGQGFFGVSREPLIRHEGVVGAAGETVRTLWDTTTLTVGGLGRLFSPSGVQEYAGQLADSATGVDPSTRPGALRPVGDAPDPAVLSLDPDNAPVRPVSILGIVQIGSGVAENGWMGFLALFAAVNLTLALINLVPILPFDGGHAVIALYEGIRGRIAGRPYRVDITKLLPLTYGVVFILGLLFVTSLYLDAANPLSVP